MAMDLEVDDVTLSVNLQVDRCIGISCLTDVLARIMSSHSCHVLDVMSCHGIAAYVVHDRV